jgi:hypothetical protein
MKIFNLETAPAGDASTLSTRQLHADIRYFEKLKRAGVITDYDSRMLAESRAEIKKRIEAN